jgi:hypothetical protein
VIARARDIEHRTTVRALRGSCSRSSASLVSAWMRWAVAEDFAGGADRVEGVALAGAPPWWAFGPADLDDAFALSDQESGEPGAVAAGSFDCPASPVRQVMVGELKQSPIAAGVGEGFGATQGRPDRGDRCGGESVAVGVDANDAIDGFGQRGQLGVPLAGGGGWAPAGVDHRAAEL